MSKKADYDHMENIVMGEVQRIQDTNDPMMGMYELGILAGWLSKMSDQVRVATVEFSERPQPDSQQ